MAYEACFLSSKNLPWNADKKSNKRYLKNYDPNEIKMKVLNLEVCQRYRKSFQAGR